MSQEGIVPVGCGDGSNGGRESPTPDQAAIPVSVVIPAYERATMVGRAVRSALSQIPPPREVIVVDDASSDTTGAVARDAGAIVVTLSTNSGEGAARNAGIDAATHEWIALLDSDDVWQPGHLDRLWGAKADFVLISDTCITDGTRRRHGNPGRRPRVLRSPADAVWPGNPCPPSSSMFRRSDARAIGGFRSLPLAADLDFWLRLLERGEGLSLPAIGCTYYEHGGNVSAGRTAEMAAAVRTIVETTPSNPWKDQRLQGRLAASTRFADAREKLRTGRVRAGIWSLVPLLLHPAHLVAVAHLVLWRLRLRGGWW